MIITAVLYAIYAILYALTAPLRLLNDVVLPADFIAAMGNVGGYLQVADTILPAAALISVMSLFLIIEGSIWGFKVFNWALKRLPTQS
jgi:hypothetical protein